MVLSFVGGQVYCTTKSAGSKAEKTGFRRIHRSTLHPQFCYAWRCGFAGGWVVAGGRDVEDAVPYGTGWFYTRTEGSCPLRALPQGETFRRAHTVSTVSVARGILDAHWWGVADSPEVLRLRKGSTAGRVMTRPYRCQQVLCGFSGGILLAQLLQTVIYSAVNEGRENKGQPVGNDLCGDHTIKPHKMIQHEQNGNRQ